MTKAISVAGADRQRDMYDVLGVTNDADYLNIRRVYRERVRTLRLDVSQEPEAEERLRELTHAYAVLSNARSRLLYDRLRDSRAGKQIPDWPHLDDEELIIWVLGRDRRKQPQPRRATRRPSGDLVTRWFAASGFVIALLLLVLLLRG